MKSAKSALLLLFCFLSSTAFSFSSGAVGPNLNASAKGGAVYRGANLGSSIAISADGKTALVGGAGDNAGAGAVWVFTRTGSTWIEQQKITASDSMQANMFGVNFGISVAISADGNTALIGGRWDDSAGNAWNGAAWVFTRSGHTWIEQAKITVTDDIDGAWLGSSVALSADGNTALISGPADNHNVGAAWVFTRAGTVWTEQRKITVSDQITNPSGPNFAVFGSSVAISADGNTALVGGRLDNGYTDSSGRYQAVGAAWVFTRTGSVWSEQEKIIPSDNKGSALFGSSVSLSAGGNEALIGGFADNSYAGAAWVFARIGLSWNEQQKLTAPKQTGNHPAFLGVSVAMGSDGNTALIGGSGEDNNTGSAWVFSGTGGNWNAQKIGISDDIQANSCPTEIGDSVALNASTNTAFIGGWGDNSCAGATWAFTPSGPIWAEQQKITVTDEIEPTPDTASKHEELSGWIR